jgi:GNAT superfamily N-acetyltransferase
MEAHLTSTVSWNMQLSTNSDIRTSMQLGTRLDPNLSWGRVHDVATASAVIASSWKENRDKPLDYTPEFLQSFLSYPAPLQPPVLAPAIYSGDLLVAFVAAVPRMIRIENEIRTIALITFFTVAPEWKGKGLGKAVWAECLLQAKAAGYDGAIHYCVEGNISNQVTLSAATQSGFQTQRIFQVRYLMRLLRSSKADKVGRDANPQEFLDAAKGIDVPITRVWSHSEAEWQCKLRSGAASTSYSSGSNTGVLNGYIQQVADSAKTSCLFIENVLWGSLVDEERRILVDQYIEEQSKKATIAVLPLLECADVSPFTAAGFRRSTRSLNAYLTLWNSSLAHETVPGMYIDVL